MDTGVAEQVHSKPTAAKITQQIFSIDILTALYDDALSTDLYSKDPEELVPLVLARAGYEKRRMESGEGEIVSST